MWIYCIAYIEERKTPPVKLKIEEIKSFRYLIGAFDTALFPRTIALHNEIFPFNNYSMAFIVCFSVVIHISHQFRIHGNAVSKLISHKQNAFISSSMCHLRPIFEEKISFLSVDTIKLVNFTFFARSVGYCVPCGFWHAVTFSTHCLRQRTRKSDRAAAIVVFEFVPSLQFNRLNNCFVEVNN